jgi:hypothetical protein
VAPKHFAADLCQRPPDDIAVWRKRRYRDLGIRKEPEQDTTNGFNKAT